MWVGEDFKPKMALDSITVNAQVFWEVLRNRASPGTLFLLIRVGPESRNPNPNVVPANRLPLRRFAGTTLGLGFRGPHRKDIRGFITSVRNS